jgi:hypothetical protein
MRTALLAALLVLLPCAPARAFSGKELARTVAVVNGTSLKVDVLIKEISPSGGNFGQQRATLEAGESRTFRIRGDLPLTVSVSADNGLSVTRVFSADQFQPADDSILIALDSQGNLQLLGPDDPRPNDPPPSVSPPTASLSRESLLAALCSSGLLGLAVVGLLINRHD